MSDLTAFLLARLDDDENLAHCAGGDAWTVDNDNHLALPMVKMLNLSGFRHIKLGALYETAGSCDAQTDHIARHDPERVLAEVAAKRRIVTATVPIEAAWLAYWHLRVLASVYSDHPDYRQEWKP